MCLPFPLPPLILNRPEGRGQHLPWMRGIGPVCWAPAGRVRKETVPAGSGPSVGTMAWITTLCLLGSRPGQSV